jgi:hypothetical protein
LIAGTSWRWGSAVGNITHQASQIVGFVSGAAVVATIGSHRTLGIDAGTFGISALIVLIVVKRRPAAARTPGKRPTVWSVSMDGIRIVSGNPALRTPLVFGWLAGRAWNPPLAVVVILWLLAGVRRRPGPGHARAGVRGGAIGRAPSVLWRATAAGAC